MDSITVEELNQKLHLATSPNAALTSEDKIPEAREFAKNLKNSSEGLTLCLTNFTSLEKDASIFTLKILTYWIEYRFSEIPPEVISAIYEFLNTTAFEKLLQNGREGSEVLAKAQAIFTIKTYLEIFPEAIQSFFVFEESKIRKTTSLRYALYLLKQLTTPSPNTFEQHRTIIQKMQDDGSLEGLSQVLQNEIKRDNVAVQVLIYYARFMDVDFLDEEFFECLTDNLQNVGPDEDVPLVYLSLLQRQEDKRSFIDLINLDEILAGICSNPSIYKNIVLARFGTLISYCGYSLPDDKKYYDFAIQIGSLPSKKATTSVLNYIISFTLKNPDNLENTLNFLFTRLKLHYEKRFQPPQDGPHEEKKREINYDAEFVESLLQVSFNCFASNQELSEHILQSFISSIQNIGEHLPELISVLSVTLSLLKSNIQIVQIDSLVPILTQLIQNALNSPSYDEPNSIMYSIFFDIVLLFDDFYPTPIIFQPPDIFRSLVQFSLNPNIYQWKFQKSLSQCCLKYGHQTNINEGDLTLFSELPTPSTGKIYGSLINCAPIENRPQIVEQTIEKSQESLKGNPDENVLLFSISIYTTMKCPLEEPVLTNTLTFLQEVLSNTGIQENDYYLSKAIKSLSSLGLAGTQTFLEFYPNVSSIESATALAKLALSIRRIAVLKESEIEENIPNNDPGLHVALDKEWIPKFSSYLMEKLQEFSSSAPFYEKEELGNYFNFINSVVLFISHEIQNVQPRDIITLANTIVDGINTFFDSPEMNNALFVFALALMSIEEQEILEILTKFVQISVNFIYTEKLNLLASRWMKVLTNLIKFYHAANETIQPAFQAAFTETVQGMGASPISMQNFLESLAGSDPNSLIPFLQATIDFFSEFYVNRIYV